MKFLKFIIGILIGVHATSSYAQDIELFQQFNGRYDYTAIGNTLNPFENNLDSSFCFPLESSSANLILSGSTTVVAAYLYWAGSGTGDTSVTLNDIPVEAIDTYTVDYTEPLSDTLTYFSCYADITDIIVSEGNTTYEFSDLDITDALTNSPGFCSNRTNFAGWSIYVIYEDPSLPLNQLNLYQGLEIINRNNQEKIILIDNLNVIDNQGAKIGFLAWEGDNSLNYGESLSINNNVLSNPPLNLSDNAFNGTNSFTNSNMFYNCDLDVYDIQDNINIGDTSATIKMTTGGVDEFGVFRADLIIINNIVTVLNSQLPDATIALDSYTINCGDRTVNIDYTVYNINSTDPLPAHTPIAFYADGVLIGQTMTQNEIPIGASETGNITISIPSSIADTFLLTLAVDDDGTGNGIIIETSEINNLDNELIELLVVPPIQTLPSQLTCNEGFNSGTFNLVQILQSALDTTIEAEFYETLSDLEANQSEIINPEAYSNSSHPMTVYAKVDHPPCYDVYAFDLLVENCPPYVPEGFSPNDDGKNDWFNIQGLYDIFEDHELKIFNRYGTLIFEGNNDKKWYGRINRGLNNHGKLVPVGTYFYILNPNDMNYKPLVGWVYVNY
ncbi:gliding motility-associated C-terminal domain-containing protein [Psychroserpens algicola]|uniref:Gliding motility-associated C-terminal domain-containing protein n=1 Tax=Psychroserpens algicola TaxID=1719034 RepID=A0ABT0HC22_9FLAO|nr:gliding motility-associated C-terminal domain-containing protein [Psychroserpens algicola]MCK8481614.1 gliding motility-associated C-terminal domain-containing protein [Psychroserpens algicola]